jgi:phosphatidylserine/phosphatidylglycerophosphate/cardiolipin synthase-like enzyme
VQGRVIDAAGVGIPDLVVGAFDVEVILSDELLRNTATRNDPVFPGLVRTDAAGNFNISYPSGEYGLESNPDIRVRVYDSVKRLLKETDVHEDVTTSVLVLPDIVIARADAEGWYVTLSSGVPQRLTTGNSIEFLIDNEEAWGHITNSVGIANGHIRFVLLLWDVEDMITLFNPGQPVIGSPAAGRKLDDEILAANVAPRSLPVGIVMWDVLNWPDWMPPDFTSQCSEFFTKPGQTIGFRSYNIHLFTPMHAKCAIVPTPAAMEGYLIGSPFIQEYFDDHIHRIDEPRRGEMHWPKNQIVIPIHDVSSHIRGPAVADIDATFRLHWDSLNQPADPPATPIPVPPAQADNVEIQIVRTLPGDRFAGLPHGETGVLEAYLRAIKNATDYIYIENQYFTSDDIADALLLALKQKPALQVIMLINNRVDVPLYGAIGIPVFGWLFDGWQVNLIERLLENLTASERDRIGIFTRWTHDASSTDNPKPRIIRNYVHSKVAVVDDKWATAGSTNLDGVGLKTSQHFLLLDTLLLGIPDFTDRRSSEMNAVIYNGVEAGHPPTDKVALLRRRLWSEHLGFVDGAGNPNPNAAQVTTRPAAGWLSLWKERATANVNALKANPPAVHPARILPFPHDQGDVSHLIDKVSTYLNLNGIDPSTLKLEEEVRDFRFQTGKWV